MERNMTHQQNDPAFTNALGAAVPAEIALDADSIAEALDLDFAPEGERDISCVQSAAVIRALLPKIFELWNARRPWHKFPDRFLDIEDGDILICTFSETSPGKMTGATLVNRKVFRISASANLQHLHLRDPDYRDGWMVEINVLAALFEEPDLPSQCNGEVLTDRLAMSAMVHWIHDHTLSAIDETFWNEEEDRGPAILTSISCAEDGPIEDAVRDLIHLA
jgi:hypothetical protein